MDDFLHSLLKTPVLLLQNMCTLCPSKVWRCESVWMWVMFTHLCRNKQLWGDARHMSWWEWVLWSHLAKDNCSSSIDMQWHQRFYMWLEPKIKRHSVHRKCNNWALNFSCCTPCILNLHSWTPTSLVKGHGRLEPYGILMLEETLHELCPRYQLSLIRHPHGISAWNGTMKQIIDDAGQATPLNSKSCMWCATPPPHLDVWLLCCGKMGVDYSD